MHPAILDCLLHLSAAALSTTTTNPSTTKVPTSISTLTIGEVNCEEELYLVAQPSLPTQNGSVLCQYKLPTSNGCKTQVNDLLVKPMKHVTVGNVIDATIASPTLYVLYETQLQVAIAATPPSTFIAPQWHALQRPRRGQVRCQPMAAYVKTQVGGSPWFQLVDSQNSVNALLEHINTSHKAFNAATLPVQVVNRMLELWQTISAQGHGTRVNLLTEGQLENDLGPTGDADMACSAALSALMRVAASENPGMTVTCSAINFLHPLGREVRKS